MECHNRRDIVKLETNSDDNVFNKPFVMWIHRKGMEMPYFVGYITEEDWEEIDW